MSLLSDIIINETTTIPNELGDIVKIVKCNDEEIKKLVKCTARGLFQIKLKHGRSKRFKL